MDGSAHIMTKRFRPGPSPSPSQSRALRDAFGSFATGVTVVTTLTKAGPVGMTANSFSSVSLDPPLALWSIAKTSDRFETFAQAERYAIHILAEDQAALSTGFAQDSGYFEDTSWTDGADGIPELAGALCRFDCLSEATHDAGDHVILVGRVLEVFQRAGAPLLFTNGQYGAVSQSSD